MSALHTLFNGVTWSNPTHQLSAITQQAKLDNTHTYTQSKSERDRRTKSHLLFLTDGVYSHQASDIRIATESVISERLLDLQRKEGAGGWRRKRNKQKKEKRWRRKWNNHRPLNTTPPNHSCNTARPSWSFQFLMVSIRGPTKTKHSVRFLCFLFVFFTIHVTYIRYD